VNHNWSGETGPERLLLPFEIFVIIFILLEQLCRQRLLFLFSAGFLPVSFSIGLVLEVESNWKLEIELNGTALMSSLQGIVNLNIDLWSIEGTISGIQLPWLAELIQSRFKSSLGLVPKCFISESLFRSGGEFELKLEAKDTVNML